MDNNRFRRCVITPPSRLLVDSRPERENNHERVSLTAKLKWTYLLLRKHVPESIPMDGRRTGDRCGSTSLPTGPCRRIARIDGGLQVRVGTASPSPSPRQRDELRQRTLVEVERDVGGRLEGFDQIDDAPVVFRL